MRRSCFLGAFLFLLFFRSFILRRGSGFRVDLRSGFRCRGSLRLRIRCGFRVFRHFAFGSFFLGTLRGWGRCFAAFVEAVHGLIDLVDHFFAYARNFHQLLRGHAGELFHVGDAGGFDLFDGLRPDAGKNRQRSCGRSERGHLLFDLAALLFLALDVYVPTDELAGQADVLTFLADGQGKLGVFDDYFELFVLGIGDLHARHLRGAQRFLREGDGFLVIRNNVDFFAAEFADDGLHAHTLHAHARAHGIHMFVTAGHGDLGTLAGFAGGGANLHGAVIDFGHFHFEKALDERSISAGHDHLRPLGGAVHGLDDHAQTFADIVGFELGLLSLGQARFGAAHVNDEVGAFGSLHDHGDKLAGAVVILVVNGVALGFAHLLQDHLLGGLRSDAAQHFGGFGADDFRADFRAGILLLRVGQADFAFRVSDFLDDGVHRVHVHLAGFLIELSAQVLFGLIELASRHHHGIFDGGNYHFRFNVLFPAQHLDLLVKQIRHFSSLKFHYQVRLANRFERYLDDSRVFSFQFHADFPVRKTFQAPFEKLGLTNRFASRDLGQTAGKTFELRGLFQRAVQSRRANFQGITRPRNQLFHVENDAELLAHALAIGVTDIRERV